MTSAQRGPRPAEFREAPVPAPEPQSGQAQSREAQSREAQSGEAQRASAPLPPVWLLDIDGVLNAFEALDQGSFRRAVANGYLITWDAELTERIHELHTTGRVEIRWLTTWAEHANTYIAPLLGWTELVVAGQPAAGLEWWKLRYAVEVVEVERRRLVWTDDDLRTSRHASAWLRHQAPGDVLTICPDPVTGLTHRELDRVAAWLEPRSTNT